ncbi:MAG: ABC transporter substrate-binding protein [Candidatus Aminicenantes bacterium]|nr:ABC transporter substrate-binding protein [Candidatus Aminicenantes bacterium]
MRKIYTFFALLVLIFSSCQKEKPDLYTLGIFWFTDAPTLNDVRRGVQAALEDNGLFDKANVRLDLRNAKGSIPEAQKIAKELVADEVDMIIVFSTPCLQAVLHATRTIPIVFSSVANPFLAGAGKSETDHLSNVTGISSRGPIKESLLFIKEVLPNVKTIGTLWTPSELNSEYYLELARAGAEELNMKIIAVPIASANEILLSAQVLINDKVDAIYQISDNTINASFEVIGRVAEENAIPLFGGFPPHTLNGACAAMGWDFYAMGYKAGQIALQVKNGTSPNDIPIQYMTEIKLHLNLEAAKKQGIVFADDIVERADEIVNQEKKNVFNIE